MPSQGGIQLLPETRKSIEVRVPGENRWLSIGLGCFGAVLILYGGLALYVGGLESGVEERDARLASLEKRRTEEKEKYSKILVFSKQAGQIGAILRNHLFWSKAFSRIEGRIQPRVQMKLFSASAPRQDVLINAQAPDYAVVAKQLAAFTSDDAVTDVQLGNVKIDNSGKIDFAVTVHFDAEKLLKRSDNEF